MNQPSKINKRSQPSMNDTSKMGIGGICGYCIWSNLSCPRTWRQEPSMAAPSLGECQRPPIMKASGVEGSDPSSNIQAGTPCYLIIFVLFDR